MEYVPLGDLLKVKSGYAFKSRDWLDCGVPVVKIANIKDGWVTLDGCSFVSEEVAEQARAYALSPGDVLISMTGHIGQVAKVRNEGRMLLNQRVGRFLLLEPNRLNPEYLFQWLRLPKVRASFEAHAYGAAQPNISPTLIEQQEIPLPSLAVQNRIASILSAYDDLIENNTRRIAILEEMARRIYEEWFVHYRFPGHESVRMVEAELGSVPEGWGVERLEHRIKLVYGKALKAEERQPGNVPVYGSSGIVGRHDTSLVDGPGIILGRKGNVGSVHWSEEPFYPIDTVYFVESDLPRHFVFFNLQYQNFLNNDAAVPGLSRAQAYALPLIVPPAQVLASFDSQCQAIMGLARLLERKNANLRTTRDLLLPRLISGELDVSDLPMPEEAAA